MNIRSINLLKNLIIGLFIFLASIDAKAFSFGGRSAEQIQSHFDVKGAEIDRVYQRILRKNPELPNLKIVFKLSLDKDGNVSHCDWKKDGISFEELNRSVCRLIKEMNFGKGATAAFIYPISFFPS